MSSSLFFNITDLCELGTLYVVPANFIKQFLCTALIFYEDFSRFHFDVLHLLVHLSGIMFMLRLALFDEGFSADVLWPPNNVMSVERDNV